MEQWKWIRNDLGNYLCERKEYKYLIENGRNGFTKRTTWFASIKKGDKWIMEFVMFQTLKDAKEFCYKAEQGRNL